MKTSLFKKIDLFLDHHLLLLILFALIILLRIPNFFEPYWYGDEAIYLTLGTALRQGGKLYTTIIDHKTPLIYYLAMVPNQFYFRVLNLFWMLTTTTLFFTFAKKLLSKTWAAFLAGLIMVIFTTLPWLEGNIPNGELFVMGFVMAGAVLFSQSLVFQNFFGQKANLQKSKLDTLLLVGAGFMMGLGILTKVPAILDTGAFLAIFWLIMVREVSDEKSSLQKMGRVLTYLLNRGVFFAIGLALPILLSIVYFVLKGQGQDYLDYGLLYNFRYSQSYSVDLGNNLINFAFGMTGKTIILFILVILVSLNHNQLQKRTQFISLYVIFTLYSVLLSSRPYPHYFVQMVPAIALLIADIIMSLSELKKNKLLQSVKNLALGAIVISLTVYVMISLEFRPYSTTKYYQQFYKYATKQISQEEYENSFDGTVSDNRIVSKMIADMGIQKMFIWGTNPLLYAQSKTIPTSRFTVSFHIKDFNDYDRTFAQIENEKPKLIIVMKNETQNFPKLEEYLASYYLQNTQLNSMTLYLRNDKNGNGLNF